MKKMWLIFGIILVLISWGGNYTFFAAKQLSHPVMLKHYYQFSIDENLLNGNNKLNNATLIQFELSYLVNRNEDTEITTIDLPGLQVVDFYPSSNKQYSTHYILKSIYVYINANQLLNNQDQLFSKEAHVSFLGYETRTFQIGEIRIIKSKESDLIEQMSGGGSSEQTGFNQWKANQALQINDVKISSDKDVTPWLKMQVNDLPLAQGIFPIALKKGEKFNVGFKWSFPESDPNRLNFYNVEAKVRGEGQNGKPFLKSMVIPYRPNFTDKNINDLVKQLRSGQDE